MISCAIKNILTLSACRLTQCLPITGSVSAKWPIQSTGESGIMLLFVTGVTVLVTDSPRGQN